MTFNFAICAQGIAGIAEKCVKIGQEPYAAREGRVKKQFHALFPEGRAALEGWLNTAPHDVLVFIDVPTDSPFYLPEPGERGYGLLRNMLASQTAFRPVLRREYPQHRASVTVWRRNPGGHAAAPRPERSW